MSSTVTLRKRVEMCRKPNGLPQIIKSRKNCKISIDNMKQAEKASLGHITVHICKSCLRVFKLHFALVNHIKKVHFKQKHFSGNLVSRRKSSHYLVMAINMLSRDMQVSQQNLTTFRLKDKVWICCICQKLWLADDECSLHILKHIKTVKVELTKDSHCKVCKKTFPSKSRFAFHIYSFHFAKNPPICFVCGDDVIDDISHYFSHGILITNFEKLICNVQTKSIFEGSCHLESENTLNDKQICNNLIESDADHISLNEITIEDNANFTCTFCDMKFTFEAELKTHVIQHGPKELHKICSNCGTKFDTLSKLRRHMYVHTKEKPFKCEICLKAFNVQSNLKNHQKRIHGEQHKLLKCGECDREFRSPSGYKDHLARHRGEKPNVCELCGALFLRRYSLKLHLQSHLQERPFQCDVCTAAFGDSSSLKRHQRIHSGEKPFSCDLCSSKFSQSNSLRYHLMTVHRGHPDLEQKMLRFKSRNTKTNPKLSKRANIGNDEGPSQASNKAINCYRRLILNQLLSQSVESPTGTEKQPAPRVSRSKRLFLKSEKAQSKEFVKDSSIENVSNMATNVVPYIPVLQDFIEQSSDVKKSIVEIEGTEYLVQQVPGYVAIPVASDAVSSFENKGEDVPGVFGEHLLVGESMQHIDPANDEQTSDKCMNGIVPVANLTTDVGMDMKHIVFQNTEDAVEKFPAYGVFVPEQQKFANTCDSFLDASSMLECNLQETFLAQYSSLSENNLLRITKDDSLELAPKLENHGSQPLENIEGKDNEHIRLDQLNESVDDLLPVEETIEHFLLSKPSLLD